MMITTVWKSFLLTLVTPKVAFTLLQIDLSTPMFVPGLHNISVEQNYTVLIKF